MGEGEVASIQEKRLKLILGNNAIPLNIVLLHCIVQLVLRNLVAHFRQCRHNILARNVSRIVSIELVEDGIQLVLVEEGFHVEGSCEELRVIDFVITKVIDFFDNLLDLVIRHVQVHGLNSLLELLSRDLTRIVLIDLRKLLLQVPNLLTVDHLDQHVHGGLLQDTDALVLAEALDNVPVHLCGYVVVALALLLNHFEPIVLQRFAGCQSLLGVGNQQLLDQIQDIG